MNTVKYIIFFIKESPKFMGESLLYLILHKNFFRTMKCYAKEMKKWDKSLKKYGAETTYCKLNRNIEMEI